MDLKTFKPLAAKPKKKATEPAASEASAAASEEPPAKKAKKSPAKESPAKKPAAAAKKASKAKKPKPEPVIDQDLVERAASPSGPSFTVRTPTSHRPPVRNAEPPSATTPSIAFALPSMIYQIPPWNSSRAGDCHCSHEAPH